MGDASRFQWSVAESGYRWVRAVPVAISVGGSWMPLPTATVTKEVRAALGFSGTEEDAGSQQDWYLTARIPRGSKAPAHVVTEPPRDQPMLFEEFGNTAPTKQGISAFAHRHGLLGGPESRLIRTIRTRGGQPEVVLGEPLSAWRTAIGYMSLVCHFKQRLDRKQVPAEPTVRPFSVARPGFGTLDQRINDLAEQGFWNLVELPDDPTTLDTTRATIQMLANVGLSEWVSARLFWHHEWRQYTLRLVPKHLLGAMWLQFAESITTTRDYTSCETCGKWIEVSTRQSGATKRRRYCCDRCRVQAHRKQKVEVLELAKTGMSPAEIARRTGKDKGQVKTWVQGLSRGRSLKRRAGANHR